MHEPTGRAAKGAEKVMQRQAQPVQILLVEDNPMDRRLLYAFLKKSTGHAYEIAHTSTLTAAIEYLSEHAVDIVLLDLFLPDSEGLDTFKRLHAYDAKLPIVLLTSLSDEQAATRAVRMGAQDYLVKWEVNPSLIWKSILYSIERMRLTNALVKSRQREREASEARFRKIIEENADGIVIVGHDGKVRYLNPAAEALLGQRAEQFVGGAFPYGMTAGKTSEIEIEQPGASPIYAEMHVAESHWELEPVLLASLRNITERREAEQALRAAKEEAERLARLKSSFLANMSHEIRTPLTSVLGFASVLVEEIQDEQHRSFLQMIERSGKRLMETINSVLDLARLETHGLNPAQEPIDPVEKARDVVELLRPIAERKHLALTFQTVCTCANHLALLDEGCFVRILQNLVGNAIKFTDAGRVAVRIRCGAGEALLEVADTGVGISETFLPQLYQAFQQESTGLTRSHEGSGLGLTITKRLVEILDGRIEVESEKGVGSTFRVWLPLPEPEDAPPPVESAQAPEEPLLTGRPRILVLDDQEQTLVLIRHILADKFDVCALNSADEALAHLEAQRFDALFLDINLRHGRSGAELLPEVRALPNGRDLPVVASTAYAMPGDRENLLAAGFDAYLGKPFVKQDLLRVLYDVLTLTPRTPAADRPVAMTDS